jgi:hypothetical protein
MPYKKPAHKRDGHSGRNLMFVSDAATFVTGHTLVVDGGILASGVNP